VDCDWHLSTTGHEKPCWKLGGPSPKAKYYLETVSETECLQAVEALCPQGNVRPRAFCIMILRVTVSGKVKSLDEAEAKASLNRASSRML